MSTSSPRKCARRKKSGSSYTAPKGYPTPKRNRRNPKSVVDKSIPPCRNCGTRNSINKDNLEVFDAYHDFCSAIAQHSFTPAPKCIECNELLCPDGEKHDFSATGNGQFVVVSEDGLQIFS